MDRSAGKPQGTSRVQKRLESCSLGRFVSGMCRLKMVRFFLVAGLNTAFGYALFSFLIFIGLHYTLAALIGQIIGVLFNFRTYGSLVFRNKKLNLLPRFFMVYAIMYFCNIGGMTLIKSFFGANDYVASAIMCVPVGLLGFVLNKLLVFERRKTESDTPKLVFWMLAFMSLGLMLWGSFDAGMSGDETYHDTQAAHVYDYYRTFGQDSTAAVVTEDYNLPLYGQVVDNFAYALSQWFGIEDIMQLRHIVNTICGWMGILFTALLAYRIAGRKYLPAILTFLLFVCSPRFLGHSFNNLKDVGLASFTAMSLFYMVVFLQDFPKVKWSTSVMLAVGIGLAMSVRVGGLILMAYFILFCLLRFFQMCNRGAFAEGGMWRTIGRFCLYGIGIFLGACLLCLILWPYAMQAPLHHVFGALLSMNDFEIAIRQLFEGRLQMSTNLPWYYTPKFILMTIPVAVIVGALAYLATAWRKENRFWGVFLCFCFLFPVVWIILTKANVYGGWRHSMFCYPPLVAMAGLGFYSLHEMPVKPALRWILGLFLPIVLLIGPVRHIIANHPYEYVYFNELAGGIRRAYGCYEMDYYYHSTREGAEWVMANADTSLLEPGRKIKVATWHVPSVSYYLRKDTVHFRTVFSRIYEMGNNDWDYAVFTLTGVNPEWIKNKEIFPPKNTVHTIDVDGMPICIVLKREDKSDYYAYQAYKSGKPDSAKMLYQRAYACNPGNEQVLENLSRIYLDERKPDSAWIYASRWASLVPSNTTALALLADAYMQVADYESVLDVANQIKFWIPDEPNGYWLASSCYLEMGMVEKALDELHALVEISPDPEVFLLMSQLYESLDCPEGAALCLEAALQWLDDIEAAEFL